MELVRRDDPAPLDGRGDAVDPLGEVRALAVHRPRRLAMLPRCGSPSSTSPAGSRASRRRGRARARPSSSSARSSSSGKGHEVTHHEVDPDAPAGRLARRLIDHQAGRRRLPPHASAAVLAGTKRLLPELGQADVVVATTTGTAVALAAWRLRRRLETPLVGIVAGLLNDPWGRARRATTLPLLRRMHAMLYGPGEAPGLEALDPGLAGRVHVNRFGVDTGFWSPGGTPAGGVLAIGNDGHRDWATLVAAAPQIDAEVTVLTRHPAPAVLPGNVRWRPADWHRRLLERRRGARGVPLRRRRRGAGEGRAAAVGPERDAAGVRLRAPGRPHADARPVGSRGSSATARTCCWCRPPTRTRWRKP